MFNLSSTSRKQKQREAVFHTEAGVLAHLRKTGLLVLLVIAIHSIFMMWLEGLDAWDAIWLSFTTISTVGYGDHAATTVAGQAATIILLYLLGVVLLAQLASDYVEYRVTRYERINKGSWRWNMHGHIQILNSPRMNAEQYFLRLIFQIREHPQYRKIPIQILTMGFEQGLPASLKQLGVVHYCGSANNENDLDAINISDAKHILVLAPQEYASSSDGITFDVVHRLMEKNVVDRAIVECVQDENRIRLHALGANVIVRPIRSYPEIIVRSIVAPGAEKILEDLFTHEGDHPERYDFEFENILWSDIVSKLICADLGTALGVITHEGEVIVQREATQRVSGTGLIIMVRSDKTPELETIQKTISSTAG